MPLKPLKSIVTGMVAVLMVSSSIFAQEPGQDPGPQPQVLTPDQLDDLVAPVALYPDELLSQTLVAATYPLEVVEAFQWMQKNPSPNEPALTQAAQLQNWDPSVQALVVFPDVLRRLNDDVAWTTTLGQAFQTQQQDVMDAVQRLRARAQQAGKLESTAQENVVMAEEDGAPAIEIEPVDPDVIYVPVYDPVVIWGPARWYPYPHWVGGLYFGFGPAINVGWLFGPGWGGWGGWGWHPGWGNHTVIVNNTFIQVNHFNETNHDMHATSVWTHDPAHAARVPYAKQSLPQAGPRAFQPQPTQPAVHAEIPRNVPEPRFTPRPVEDPRPAPVVRQALEPRPVESPRPAPAVRPAPEARPAPAPRPEPAFRPAPAPRPAPAFHAAPAPAFHAAPAGGGGRRR